MEIVIALLLGYLFGSIPWSLIVGKVFYKVDIREHGSGNLGASNAGRTLGKKAGFSVALLDLSKALVAMLIAVWLTDKNTAVYAGIAASLGHCYPIFAQFKGGKAVSTAAGYLLGLSLFVEQNGIFIIVIGLVTFFGMLKLFKMASLASITFVTVSTISLFLLQDNLLYSVSFFLIAVIVVYRHHENIKRLLNKEERKITWM
jgi:acyl phosphate:glycerol-3-phosphate acyltransferase